jgi:alkylation response protein AidB-like acyl-CoA dehydrogenase
MIVMAVTDPDQRRHGISAFVVERGTPGFMGGKKENKLGMRASDTSEVVFQDCRVPADSLVGVEGEGFSAALQVLEAGRVGIAALSVGLAQGAFDAARRYAGERRQFGHPIASFQAIQWKLADMAMRIEAARLLTYRAAWLKDQGTPGVELRTSNVEPGTSNLTLASSTAKLYASEIAVRVAEESVQIHGGYGFVKDYSAEKYFRDVKLCTIGEGTSEVQRLVIARQLLGGA